MAAQGTCPDRPRQRDTRMTNVKTLVQRAIALLTPIAVVGLAFFGEGAKRW